MSKTKIISFISLTQLVSTDVLPAKEDSLLFVFKWLRLSRYPCWLFEQQIKRAPKKH